MAGTHTLALSFGAETLYSDLSGERLTLNLAYSRLRPEQTRNRWQPPVSIEFEVELGLEAIKRFS